MKRHAGAARPIQADPQAVSSVVAAVLLFALFSTAFLTWTVTTLPDLVADNEKAHEDEMMENLAAIQTGLERLSTAGSLGTISQTFQLSADTVPLLQPTPSQGDLEGAAGFRFEATFTDPSIHLVDGSVSGAPDQPAGPPAITEVGSVSVLQLALSTSNIRTNALGWVQVVADDGTDSVVARLTHWGSGLASTCNGPELELSVNSPLGSTDHLIACVGEDLPTYTIDLLSSRFPFRSGLSQLDDGYTLTFTDAVGGTGNPTASGSYLGVYTNSTGFTRVLGTGQPNPGMKIEETGDRLLFLPDRREYVDQVLGWEGGGISVMQDAVGTSLAVEPDFSLKVAGSTGFLRWTVVDLDVVGALSGTGAATATVTHLGTTSVLLSADAAQFNVTSQVADAWASFFDARIDAQGTADATSTSDGSKATLTLSQGAVTQWFLELRVIRAQVDIH